MNPKENGGIEIERRSESNYELDVNMYEAPISARIAFMIVIDSRQMSCQWLIFAKFNENSSIVTIALKVLFRFATNKQA